MHPFDRSRFPLEIRLLGAPGLYQNDLAIAQPVLTKSRALLYYLAMTKRPHTRAALASLLWSDQSDAAARANLRKVLLDLSATFGDYLAIDRHTIGFRPHTTWCDAVELAAVVSEAGARPRDDQQREGLEQALALYRGDFLEGFYVRHALEFEHWMLTERVRVRELVLQTLHNQAIYRAQTGQLPEAIALLRRLLELEPWREEIHRQLIEWLAQSGQRGAALAQYATLTRVLAEELEVEPAAESIELFQQIRRGLIGRQPDQAPHPAGSTSNPLPNIVVDWGEAPRYDLFLGRETEVAIVRRWLLDERCRLITLLGMGGIGKTSLAAEVVSTLANTDITTSNNVAQKSRFERVIWRSLLNAPPLPSLLQQLLPFLSEQQSAELPSGLDEQLRLLLQLLRRQRCLLVLDNSESLLQPGAHGVYRSGYEAYGQMFQQIALSDHNSCLLITSREQPKELLQLEASNAGVRSLRITGLAADTGATLLETQGVRQYQEQRARLVNLYSGNPLALKLVAQTIQELYGGSVSAFLAEETLIFDDIYDVLDQQFARLSGLEQEMLIWLAIGREPTSAQELWAVLAQTPPRRALLEALRSLLRRSLIEIGTTPDVPTEVGDAPVRRFSLQNVMTEYLTDRLIEVICLEIESGDLHDFRRHALVMAQAKEYVRESQVRLILQPVAEKMVRHYGREEIGVRLQSLLDQLRQTRTLSGGYAAGNILNLLVHIKGALAGEDFSHLAVWQAYLRGVRAQQVNFQQAQLAASVFTDTFAAVTSVTFTRDGQRLIAATAAGGFRIWQVDQWRPLVVVAGSSWIYSLCCSRDGHRIATGNYDRAVQLWDAHSGQCLHTLSGHQGRVFTVALDPSGTLLASGSQDQTIRLWETGSGRFLFDLRGHNGAIHSLCFSPDGRVLASGGDDQEVRLWDVESGVCLRTIQTGAMRSLCFSADGSMLAGGGTDTNIYLWDAENGQLRQTLAGHNGRINSLCFSPDDSMLASAGSDHTARLWDLHSGRGLHSLLGHSQALFTICFSPNGAWVATGSEDHTIRLWEVQSGRPLHTLLGYTHWIGRIAFSPDGTTLASVGEEPTIELWDTRSLRHVAGLQGHTDWVNTLCFSPDGKILATGGDDHTVRLWDMQRGTCLFTLIGHTDEISSVYFSPDGTTLATAGEDTTVRLWEVQSGRCLHILTGHSDEVRSVRYHPHGDLLATASDDKTVRLWNVHRGECVRTLTGHGDWVYTAYFSQDGGLLATGSTDSTVRLWNPQSGECLHILEGQRPTFSSIAFRHDAALLATAGNDNAIHLWELAQNPTQRSLYGHTDRINSVCFSPDGSTLASGGHDCTVRLWELASGRCLYTLRGHRAAVNLVCFSPDGALVASGSTDGTVGIWDAATGTLLRSLCNRPYEGMIIAGVQGLGEREKASLRALGAVDESPSGSS